jgi:hypothetical protein
VLCDYFLQQQHLAFFATFFFVAGFLATFLAAAFFFATGHSSVKSLRVYGLTDPTVGNSAPHPLALCCSDFANSCKRKFRKFVRCLREEPPSPREIVLEDHCQ